MSSTELLATADGYSLLLFKRSWNLPTSFDVFLILVLEERVKSGALSFSTCQSLPTLVVPFSRGKSPSLFNHSIHKINPDF